jgi:hypothetical protein
MARAWYRYCKKTKQIYEVGEGRASEAQGPYVIQDTMDAVAHPCTGELMDSKSEFRKVTRAHDCVEVGNEKMRMTPKPAEAVGGFAEDFIKTAKQDYGIDW